MATGSRGSDGDFEEPTARQIEKLTARIEEGLLPPIVVTADGKIVDGNTRIVAFRRTEGPDE